METNSCPSAFVNTTNPENPGKYQKILTLFPPLFTSIPHYFPYLPHSGHNTTFVSLNRLPPPQMPTKIKHIVGKTRQKQMNLIGKKPHISGPCPIKMQAEYPKNFFHFAPDPRKNLAIIGLVRKKGLLFTFNQLLKDLGIMHVSRCTHKLC